MLQPHTTSIIALLHQPATWSLLHAVCLLQTSKASPLPCSRPCARSRAQHSRLPPWLRNQISTGASPLSLMAEHPPPPPWLRDSSSPGWNSSSRLSSRPSPPVAAPSSAGCPAPSPLPPHPPSAGRPSQQPLSTGQQQVPRTAMLRPRPPSPMAQTTDPAAAADLDSPLSRSVQHLRRAPDPLHGDSATPPTGQPSSPADPDSNQQPVASFNSDSAAQIRSAATVQIQRKFRRAGRSPDPRQAVVGD